MITNIAINYTPSIYGEQWFYSVSTDWTIQSGLVKTHSEAVDKCRELIGGVVFKELFFCADKRKSLEQYKPNATTTYVCPICKKEGYMSKYADSCTACANGERFGI